MNKEKILLLISTVFSLLLMTSAYYNEHKYLVDKKLFYIKCSSTSFLHSLIIIVFILFFTTAVAFYIEGKYQSYILFTNYIIIFTIQIISIFYGSKSISKAISDYKSEWIKIPSSDIINHIEQFNLCCGFSDVTQAGNASCNFHKACSQFIFEDKDYRTFRFIAFISTSMILQIFHVFVLLKDNKTFNNGPETEFDGLVESTNL